MKELKSGINHLYVADPILREERRIAKRFRCNPNIPLDRLGRYLIKTVYGDLGIGDNDEEQQKFLEFCKTFIPTDQDFSVGVLNAHGTYSLFGKKWCYEDGPYGLMTARSMQKWIDKHDGVHDLLLLCVCNPKQSKPIIRKSLAVVPTDDVSGMNAVCSLEHKLVIPGKGAIPFTKAKIKKLPEYDLPKDIQPYKRS